MPKALRKEQLQASKAPLKALLQAPLKALRKALRKEQP
jgi:hypothetical protein